VIISTTPNAHISYAIKAANLGLHFFTEAGTCTQGMDELIKIVNDKKVIAAPSCTLRFQPSIKKMKELILNNEIGVPLAFTHHCGQYLPDWHPWEDYRNFYVSKKETGACREIVPFELNWLIWLFGWPTGITGFKAKVTSLDCDIDDIYQVVLNFDKKIMGHLQVDVIARTPTRSLRVLGSLGTIEWNMIEKTLKVYRVKTKQWESLDEPKQEVVDGYSEMSSEQMYNEEIGAFLNAIKGQTPYPHSFTDDRKILNLLFSVEKNDVQPIKSEEHSYA
jgi:predicted dehydrogenase